MAVLTWREYAAKCGGVAKAPYGFDGEAVALLACVWLSDACTGVRAWDVIQNFREIAAENGITADYELLKEHPDAVKRAFLALYPDARPWGAEDAALVGGFPVSTWTTYVSRGTAPAPDMWISKRAAWYGHTVMESLETWGNRIKHS